MTQTIRKQELENFITLFSLRQEQLKKQLTQKEVIKHKKLISCEIKALDTVLKELREELQTLSSDENLADIRKYEANTTHYLLLEKSRFL